MVLGYHSRMHDANLFEAPARCRRWLSLGTLALLTAAGAISAASFLALQDANAADAPVELPVPDPAALNPGWWDFLAPGETGN